MPGAEHFYAPVEGTLGTVGYPPYGTPPPFPEHVFIDRRPTAAEERAAGQLEMLQEEYERAKQAEEDRNLDNSRVALSLTDTHSLFDPLPLGDITVVVDRFSQVTFPAPVKAVKHVAGDLIILASVVVEQDGEQSISEWPVATFRTWQAVYRNDFVS